MMSVEEIQEWIDGENKGRETKPFIYQGNYLIFSDGWLAGLNYGKTHTEKEVELEYWKYNDKKLNRDFYNNRYFKALKLVLER